MAIQKLFFAKSIKNRQAAGNVPQILEPPAVLSKRLVFSKSSKNVRNVIKMTLQKLFLPKTLKIAKRLETCPQIPIASAAKVSAR